MARVPTRAMDSAASKSIGLAWTVALAANHCHDPDPKTGSVIEPAACGQGPLFATPTKSDKETVIVDVRSCTTVDGAHRSCTSREPGAVPFAQVPDFSGVQGSLQPALHGHARLGSGQLFGAHHARAPLGSGCDLLFKPDAEQVAEQLAVGSALRANLESILASLARIIHDSFCCKLAFLAPRVFRPRCSLRRTASAPRCAAPGASAIRFGNRAFATKSRE
jgi:hypothetical protein